MRRELRLALLLVLAGAGLVLLAAGRTWVDVRLPQAPPLPPRAEVRTGSRLAGALQPLGLVGLAGVAALAATRGRGRVAVGVLLAVAGAAAAAATGRVLSRGALAALRDTAAPGSVLAGGSGTGFGPWPSVALAGGLLLCLGGLVVAVRGGRWAALSARYDSPAERAERGASRAARTARPEVEAWDALDRGEDPTAPPADQERTLPDAPGAPQRRAPGGAVPGPPT